MEHVFSGLSRGVPGLRPRKMARAGSVIVLALGIAFVAQAETPARLVGIWLPLSPGDKFPIACESDAPIRYSSDGTYRVQEGVGSWRLQGDRLTETAPASNGRVKSGRSYVSRIAWDGSDKIVKTMPDGRRVTLRRCPALAGPPPAPAAAAGAEIEGLHGGAAGVIQARIKKARYSDVTARVFYGDLTGRGTKDAVSFVYYAAGGNSVNLTTWVWREQKGTYTLARTLSSDEVFGLEPRDVKFSPGHISVTTSVLQGADPRCCPTGKRTFTITAR
jgi:hypothetical protein